MSAMTTDHPDDTRAATRTIEAIDAAASAIWLRPDALLTGSAAWRAIEQGAALSLAGGNSAFTYVEVMARQDDGVVSALAPVRRVQHWASQLDAMRRARIEAQLARISETRCHWAGLPLDHPLVMGIVNATPDSFYQGNRGDSETAIALGRAMREAGADIIDIGAESTRPGAASVSEDEEMQRLEPVVRALAASGAVISVDTRHAKVMAAALHWGARIINDVSALEGDSSLDIAAKTGAPVVIMHMRGEPGTMQKDPRYLSASLDVADYLAQRVAACEAAGIPRHRIVVDPGIGFGKTLAHNLDILARLGLLHALGCGVLIGVSRKSSIGQLSGGPPPDQRLPGSLAGALQALRQGAQILRVHDVAETKQAIAVWQAIATGA
ncbi:MAG TPA: dihydropteroate synthase [Stellaceae bacterium]|jgi:dihydropteroate synthase|nr:dihydropteroate synthase [Stellaceae bacterium]